MKLYQTDKGFLGMIFGTLAALMVTAVSAAELAFLSQPGNTTGAWDGFWFTAYILYMLFYLIFFIRYLHGVAIDHVDNY